MHNLKDSDWHLRVYGVVNNTYLDVWIGQPPDPTYREPYTVLNDEAAGIKVLELLEHLYALQESD